MVEGSVGKRENREPVTYPRTTRIPPVILNAETASTAETGRISSVRLNAEGRDDDEQQDAEHSSGETEPLTELDYTELRTTWAGSPPVVLIIEDTTELAEVIQVTLEQMNMVAIHETHGQRALAKLHDLNPDVVLLDISLPDMIGWKILDTIKSRAEQDTSRRMPIVIVITAYDDPANRLVGKLQGVHSYLIKPFTASEIERLVARALADPTTRG